MLFKHEDYYIKKSCCLRSLLIEPPECHLPLARFYRVVCVFALGITCRFENLRANWRIFGLFLTFFSGFSPSFRGNYKFVQVAPEVVCKLRTGQVCVSVCVCVCVCACVCVRV
jgi:hypothetical protein